MLAVDVPFVSSALLQLMVARARECKATVTVARVGGRWQPLCAVYRREFADAAEVALRQGRYKIDALFERVPTLAVAEKELAGLGFSANMFRNLNTQEELEAARSAG